MYVYMSVCTLCLAGEPILIIASANTKTFVSHVTFSVHHLFLTLLNEKSLQAKITNTKRSQWSFIFIRVPFWKRSRSKQFIHLLSNGGPTTKANWSPSPRIFHCMDYECSTFHCKLSNINWHFILDQRFEWLFLKLCGYRFSEIFLENGHHF